jgi:pimeloyl-ACP methyl ester carboxylesterase
MLAKEYAMLVNSSVATRPITERFVTLSALGLSTRVLESGAGPIALLLHGNPDCAEEWIAVMNLLGATHRCIAPDIPGYGKSPEPPASFDYSAGAQAAFVDELLKALAIRDSVLVIVHDIGGAMGIAWAGAHPERLAALLITNTVAFPDFEWFPVARTWGAESWIGRLRARAGMLALGTRRGSLFKKIFWRQSPQLTEADIDRITRSFALNPAAKTSTLRQFRKMTKPEFFAGFEDILRRVTQTVPTLVLWGDQDPYVPVTYAQRFGSARVIVLPNAGHWVALTEPQRLVDEARQLAADMSHKHPTRLA